MAISGTPTVSGTFPYTVTVTDSAGNKDSFNCSVTVQLPHSMACSTTGFREVGVAFNRAFFPQIFARLTQRFREISLILRNTPVRMPGLTKETKG